MKQEWPSKFISLLASKKFFIGLLIFFVLEALWVALTGRFPMAFDEDFHLGIIKLYAHQWSPFFGHQPVGGDTFGALTRDPSYMYHYLLSFPYRTVHFFTASDFIAVLVLRLLSISFVAGGIVIFRRLLLSSGAGSLLTHVVLLFFVITPLVPYEAAQINYDNLLIPLAGLSLLWTLEFMQLRVRRKPLDVILLLRLTTICMFASLVKYAFLPVATVLALFVVYELWRARPAIKKLWHNFFEHSKKVQLASITFFVLLAGLFTQMYGYNLVHYHVPAPECDQVLRIAECQAYGAWNRNYTYAQHKTPVDGNVLGFSVSWMTTYIYSFFSVVNGEFSGFKLAQPLPLVYNSGIMIGLAGVLCMVLLARDLLLFREIRLFGAVFAGYMLSLWLQNYTDYLHLGEHVAEQGRYLLILFIPLLYVLLRAFQLLLLTWSPRLKACVLVGACLLFLQGGSVLTFILRTDPTWWWQQNPLALHLNQGAQKVLRPLIFE